MQREIATALAAMRNSPEVDDQELYAALVKSGIDRHLAARLIEFLPAAYCRVILEPMERAFRILFSEFGRMEPSRNTSSWHPSPHGLLH
jgi:hypothetical protein